MEADRPSMFLPATDASCSLPPRAPRVPAAARNTMKNRRRVNRKRRATRRN